MSSSVISRDRSQRLFWESEPVELRERVESKRLVITEGIKVVKEWENKWILDLSLGAGGFDEADNTSDNDGCPTFLTERPI
jgi:hypothetical protein